MPIFIDNLIKILPVIIIILIGIWLLKKFFNILIVIVFIAVVIRILKNFFNSQIPINMIIMTGKIFIKLSMNIGINFLPV